MLTVQEVAARLKISKYSAYRAIASGRIPHFRTRGGRNRYLVDPEVVERLAGQEDFYMTDVETADEADVLFTASEVAAKLRCSVETVRRLAVSGILRGHRNPGRNSHWRFRQGDVQAYLTNTAPDAEAAG
jgi:excisionase family DNA binding protein